jgi:PD-(D/E)XK nuclease superfamily
MNYYKKMEKLQEMFESINELKIEYDKEREKKRFNVFTALYKDNEEVRLHSRFISYLLCPKSGHGMNNVFLEIFVREILKLSEEEFDINDCEVIPNEFNKKEEDEIDILIKNIKKRQAIIVENKIDAKDSNHFHKNEGYKGQLERYYNETIDKGYIDEHIFVFFLTLNRQVSEESLGKTLKDKSNWRDSLFYGNQIREWLGKCINEIPLEKLLVKEFIQQYLNLINRMTHNDLTKEERIELKEKVAKNLESTKYLNDNFKHVKWHTVDDFWITLKDKLNINYNNVRLYSDKHKEFHKTISEVTHENKDINHGILFDFEDGKPAYISGLGKLSWGILNKEWFTFEDKYTEDICFSEFSSENTYRLIDRENMEEVVESIINEILGRQNTNLLK